MSDARDNDYRKDEDIDVDVDIDQELDLKLEEELDLKLEQEQVLKLEEKTDIDVETESKTKSEYVVDVDAEDAEVNVDIDIDEDKYIREEHDIDIHENVDKDIDIDIDENVHKDVDIDIDENVDKDIDIDIDENVHKDVDISVWETKVEVDAKNIIDGTDNDVNDVDSQKLIDVDHEGLLKMDDFAARNLAIGKSFNGKGNDGQYSLTQSNNMTDNDKLVAPTVAFIGLDDKGRGHDEHDRDEHGDRKDGDSPFQKVEVEGGNAEAGHGIDGNSDADENDSDGSVLGEALASADGIANVAAFTQDIVMGGNQQGNVANLDVVGGNLLQANDIKDLPADDDHHGRDGGHDDGDHHDGDHDGGLAIKDTDDDVNDLDAQSLLSVGYDGEVFMDDFRLDTIAIGESFNGPGNDMQFDFVQVNDLADNDELCHPEVKFVGSGGSTFQDVDVNGGEAYAGDGIHGGSSASNNGLSGSVTGSTVASADAKADVSAFTQNIVMGANLQLNDWTASVVGGDATVADNIDFH